MKSKYCLRFSCVGILRTVLMANESNCMTTEDSLMVGMFLE